MRKKSILIFVFFIFYSQVFAQVWPSSLAGRWTFDNTSDLLVAAIGNNLVLTGTHTIVPGTSAGDGAIAIGTGSYYTCKHGISANGSGTKVNEYAIMFDVMVENPKIYHSFFQTDPGNTSDGDMFANPNNQIGIGATGYSGFSLKANEWYRIVISVNLDSNIRYYVDGKLVFDGVSQAIDGRFSLDSTLLFFADEDGEDNLINVSQIAIFNASLTSAEVRNLSGFHDSNIKPYLQTPTPNSMYISWNSYENTSTIVLYGTTPSLGSSTTGAFEDIGTSPTINRWHTVKATGLSPSTRYYYRCISGTDTSEIFHFRTPPVSGISNGHIRFLKFGDNQTNALRSACIVDSSIVLLEQLYGINWPDSISFIMNSGDITGSGADLGSYMNEYFNSFSNLSAYIPSMVSIGNHEVENNQFYQFMKYEDLTGFNEKYYTFNLGSCQFIAMNTNGLYNDVSQTNWLQAQLDASANNSNIDFVFTYNHQPAHSEIWPDGNSSFVKDNLYPIEAGYPKMVMTTHGHSHCYERGTVKTTHSGNWDFRTVICGGSGGDLDRWGMYTNQTDYPEIQKAIDNYCFMLVDVDMGAKTVKTNMYSIGNTDKPRNLELMDKWHRFLNQAAPNKPSAIFPNGVATVTPTLTASAFSGLDTLMSSEFQLIPASGDFNSPLIDITRDAEDYYGDSGTPNFQPINLNNGIDLKTYTVDPGILSLGQTYLWRMRYRDENIRWSEWSDTLQFTTSTVGIYNFEDNSEVPLFPNPSSQIVTIAVPEKSSIEISKINGQIVKTIISTGKETTIDIENLSTGFYLIKIKTGNRVVIKKFIKE